MLLRAAERTAGGDQRRKVTVLAQKLRGSPAVPNVLPTQPLPGSSQVQSPTREKIT